VGAGRVYLPVTPELLRRAREQGRFEPPLHGHAVTDELAAELAGSDQEEQEYAAMQAAALDALTMLGADDRPRRMVAAVDVAAWAPSAQTDQTPSRVEVTVPVPLRRLAAVHADSADAGPVVRAAVLALTRGEAGRGTDAAVERCLDQDLGWYAAQELDVLLDD
jgi:hypothetical protein